MGKTSRRTPARLKLDSGGAGQLERFFPTQHAEREERLVRESGKAEEERDRGWSQPRPAATSIHTCAPNCSPYLAEAEQRSAPELTPRGGEEGERKKRSLQQRGGEEKMAPASADMVPGSRTAAQECSGEPTRPPHTRASVRGMGETPGECSQDPRESPKIQAAAASWSSEGEEEDPQPEQGQRWGIPREKPLEAAQRPYDRREQGSPTTACPTLYHTESSQAPHERGEMPVQKNEKSNKAANRRMEEVVLHEKQWARRDAAGNSGVSHVNIQSQDKLAPSDTAIILGDEASWQPEKSKHTTQEENQWDWMAHLRTLPSKADIDDSIERSAASQRAILENIRKEMRGMGSRITTLEQNQEQIYEGMNEHHKILSEYANQLTELSSQLDDIENRHRRNNLRIKGLSEEVGNAHLENWAQKTFGAVLQLPPNQHIEIDRIHRSLGPQPTDPARPRDIICRIHFYKEKEHILQQIRSKGPVKYKGRELLILPDLSRKTLQLRRALRPLLALLQERDIPYRWGFPFQLSVGRRGEKPITFKNLGDLPGFLTALKLPMVALPDWPKPIFPTPLPPTGEWMSKGHTGGPATNQPYASERMVQHT